MSHEEPKIEGRDSSLVKAKRKFIVNLSLFSCLAIVGAFLLEPSEEATLEPLKQPAHKLHVETYSLADLAYIKGQMIALREHPGAMPKFGMEWMQKMCEQAIHADPIFAEKKGEELKEFINNTLRGYIERREEYFDIGPASKMGYQFGMKFDPLFYGPEPPSTYPRLYIDRERIEEDYCIRDEAQWRLFCNAFDEGFVQAYFIVQEGVTVRSRGEVIRLFDE